jgi:hypothetical protein
LKATTIGVVEQPDENGGVGESAPDIDELITQLRARVDARRQAGAYPPGLEEEMSAHFQRILNQRREPTPLPDIAAPVRRSAKALPLQVSRIPLTSGFPAGEILHRSIAKVVSRQTQGVMQQVQGFAEPVQSALEALTIAVEELSRAVYSDIAQSLDALYERQAACERLLAQLGGAES